MLVKATLGSAGARVVGMALALLVGVQLARFLGAVGYGSYATVVAITVILASVATFGNSQLVIYQIGSLKSGIKHREYSLMIWVLLTCSALLLCVISVYIIITTILTVSYTSTLIILLSSLIIIVRSFFLISLAYIRGRAMIVKAQILESICQPFVAAVLLISTYVTGYLNVPVALAILIFSFLPACIVAAYSERSILKSFFQYLSKRRFISAFRRFRSANISFWSMDIVRAINGNYLVILVASFLSLHEAADFRIATTVAGALALFSSTVHVAVAPTIARLYKDSRFDDLQRLCRLSALIMSVIAITIFFATTLFGKYLIIFLFGGEYVSAYYPLVIICFNEIIIAFFGVSGVLLNMTERHKYSALLFTYATIIGISVAVPLIVAWGISGAAIAQIAMSTSWFALLYLRYRRQLVVDPCLFPIWSGKKQLV